MLQQLSITCPPPPFKTGSQCGSCTGCSDRSKEEGRAGAGVKAGWLGSSWFLGLPLPVLGLASTMDKRDLIFPFPSCLLFLVRLSKASCSLFLLNPMIVLPYIPISFLTHPHPLSQTLNTQPKINLCCGESGFSPKGVQETMEVISCDVLLLVMPKWPSGSSCGDFTMRCEQ